MMSEIGEGIESKSVRGIADFVVPGDEIMIILEDFEPVEFFRFR